MNIKTNGLPRKSPGDSEIPAWKALYMMDFSILSDACIGEFELTYQLLHRFRYGFDIA